MFFLLFIIVSISEIYLLIKLFSMIGFLYTVGIIIFTGFVGIRLMKSQGRAIMARIQGSLAQGQMPTKAMVEGLLVLASGIFLVTPGIITDTVGFLLLVPPVRSLAASGLMNHFKNKFTIVHGSPLGVHGFGADNGVVDVEWEEEKPGK
ncbi:FxsA family protein [Myxococcota bacterium]|nr:FxsA family protein [Myxococcota bacterium]MBU1535317.1 FxsA family protein [Myxococcota bacterium]